MKKLKTSQKERLLLGLLVGDITDALNTVCKVRALNFHIDYRGKIPSLSVSRPGVEPQVLFTFNTRTKTCWRHTPSNFDLQSAMDDLNSRLASFGARLMFVAERDRNHKFWAKLQVHVEGSDHMALTILDIPQGQRISDNSFKRYEEK